MECQGNAPKKHLSSADPTAGIIVSCPQLQHTQVGHTQSAIFEARYLRNLKPHNVKPFVVNISFRDVLKQVHPTPYKL